MNAVSYGTTTTTKIGTQTIGVTTTREYDTDPKTGEQNQDVYNERQYGPQGEPWKTNMNIGGVSYGVQYTDPKTGAALDEPKYTNPDGSDTTKADLQKQISEMPDGAEKDKAQKQLDKSEDEHDQYEVGTVYNAGMSTLNIAAGWGGYSKLFWSEDELLEFREKVDKIFADMYLGTSYWVSEICQHQYDVEDVEGVAGMMTPGGMMTIAGHVEGIMSSITELPDGTTQYLYKISAYVMVPEDGDDVKFNIVLNPGGAEVFSEEVEVEDGSSYSAAGTGIIVKYFDKKYSEVCVEFSDQGDFEDDEICNRIKGVAIAEPKLLEREED